MSLINDALKRASTEKPKVTDSGTPALTPAEHAPRGTSGGLPLVLCIAGIGALLVAGGLWLKSRGSGPIPEKTLANITAAKPPNASVPAEGAKPAAAETPRNPIERAAATLHRVEQRNTEGEAEADKMMAPAAKSAAEAPKTASAEVKPAPAVGKPVTLAKGSPDPAAPAKPAPLRLQAIYYRMKGPSVVINGKTLKTGDSVSGAKVTAIHRTEVEVERNGEVQTLTLH